MQKPRTQMDILGGPLGVYDRLTAEGIPIRRNTINVWQSRRRVPPGWAAALVLLQKLEKERATNRRLVRRVSRLESGG